MTDSSPLTPLEALRRARSLFRDAEIALEQMAHPQILDRRLASFRNAIVTARGCAEMLRRLKSAPGYAEWWEPWRAEMARDPLLKYLYGLRNVMLHEGETVTRNRAHFRSFSFADLPPAPRNAVETFIGDPLGRSGWKVQMPDGSLETIYFSLPESAVKMDLIVTQMPTEHLGQRIDDPSVVAAARLYVAYTGRVLESAERRFGAA